MNLNKKIKSFLNQHKKTKKRLSATALLSLLIAIAVVSSLIMPAISMTLELAAGLSSFGLSRSAENTMILGASSNMITNAYGNDANDGKSPKELSDVTLLIGDGTDWAEGCNSAAEVIEAAKAKYFLGIASDFCVFLENDFKPKNSDAEGRVAAGGDVIFQNTWNYQIGNGDYATGTALTKTDNYLEKLNFAHLITSGKVQKINTISQGKYDPVNQKEGDKYIYPDDTYKRFVVGKDADLTNVEDYYHLTWPGPKNTLYTESCNHDDVYYNEIASFYKADLINFTDVFEWLRGQSEKLFRKTATGTASVSNGVLTLSGPGTDSGAATVYFSLDSWDSSIDEINYVNVPDNANLVLNCGGSDVTIKSGTRIVKTTINGTEISNTGTISSNNNKKSEQILYNFYEASNVYVDTNFNGTILAPNADATSDDDCHGHLSGSLIAKSFEGGLEFGYRPYRGTASDILGSTAGYAIPVNKFTENDNQYLPGASFVMKDKYGKTVDSWTSTTGTDYINIPSKVDFEGRTLYDNTNNVCQNTFYTFSERAAPDGYVLNSEKTYTVNIIETVDVNSLIYSDDHSVSIPTKVDAVIELKFGEQDLDSWKIEILDTYANTDGVTSQTQRRVTIKDTNDNIIDTFYLDISNNIVTLAGHGTGAISTTTWKETVTSVSSSETDVAKMVETVVPVTSVVSATDVNNSVVTDANGSAVTETVTVTSASEVTDQEGNTVITYVPVTETSYYESSYTSYTSVIVTSEIELSKETQSTVTIPISNLSEAQNITVGETSETRNYRYVPQSLMIMPLPKSVPDFVNKPGFVFRKVDGSGALLTGADISLQIKSDSGETYSDVPWDWTTSNSKITIDPANLIMGRIYRFHENAPPAGYEKAGDIYFIKTETAIKYANSEDELNSGGTSITISSEVPLADRTITMTDIKMSGAALTLKKVDSSNNALLSGARFRLYAADGETGIPVYPLAEGKSFEVTGGQINLFNMLRNAAADTYNTSYAENGYLKEGTYYLEEVSSPSGFVQPTEPFYFTIKQSDSGYVIEAGKPQYIAFTVENTSWGQQIWVNGSASNVTKIEVYVDAPASGNLVLYEHETVKDKTASIVNGVATFELDGSKDVGRFKIQNTDYNAGLTVKEVRVYGDSSGSSSSSGTAYSIKDIVWNDDAFPAVTVSKLTFYYADADPQEVKDISVTQNQWWHSFNLSGFSKKDNVIGIEIEVGGSGTGKLVVQASDDSLILGNQSDQWTSSYTTVSAGQTYTLGSTTVPQTPSEPDDPGTSTEESAGTITAEGMTITIGNEKAGSTVSLSVEKVWSGDTGYENLRPESITVQLKRSTSADKSNPVNILEAVTLNADNKWKYTWPKQDRLQSDGVTPYYYFVEEISVPSGYTVGYTNNDGLTEGGKITITNTCITKDYDVKKVWDTKGISDVTIPTSITVKLQSSSDNGATWQDVSGKTLTLTEANSWQGKFESLPDSADIMYRAVEKSVPTGWTSESSTAADGTMTVTNTIKVGSLLVKKLWNDNGSTGSRPSSIKLNLYRSTTPPSGSGGSTSGTITPSASTGVTDDYGRLLQYSLYFYDAQMCGSDVEEKSAVSWRDDCHVSSTNEYPSDEVNGGYHDAGDHTMFGLPQGFTASTLGWSYYEFKDSFDSLGLTNHYQTIMKRFCDFFVDSTKLSGDNVTSLLVQKGDPGTDHNYWGAPETQTQSQRGNQKWTNSDGANIAAEYAAALAIYAHTFNDADSSNYLKYAKALYNYSVKCNQAYSVSGFYADNESTSEQAWAAAWLYIATGDEQYKTDCKNKLDKLNVSDSGHFWGDTTLGAATVYTTIIDPSDTAVKSKVTEFLRGCSGSGYKIFNDWGNARHNTLAQTVALIYNKHQNESDTTLSSWCKEQMNYILGNNNISSNGNNSTCFVTGFANNSSKNTHHRAASGYAYGEAKNDACYDTDGHVLVGALVGGPGSGGQYIDEMTGKDLIYQTNEVAIDYNAGLVGAAAGLFYEYHTGIPEDKAAFESKNSEVSYKDTWSGTSSSISSLSSSEPLVALALSPAEEAEIETATSAKLESSVNQLAMMIVSENEPEGTLLYTIDASTGVSDNGLVRFSNLNVENVTQVVACFDSDVNAGMNLVYNNIWDNAWVQTVNPNNRYIIRKLSSAVTVNEICYNSLQIWNGSGSITEIRLYGEASNVFTVTSSSQSIYTNETTSLTIDGATNPITWTIPVGSGITISDTTLTAGNVTGSFTITGTDSAGKTGSFTIEVKNTPFTLTADKTKIRTGDTATLTCNMEDAEYTVDKPDLVTISGKSVTANAIGTAVITATKGDRSTNVTIEIVGELNISGFQGLSTSITTMNLNSVQKLAVENAIGTLSWTSSDDTVITVDNGTVTSLKDGKATITVTDSYDNTTSSFEIEVKPTAVSPDIPEGIPFYKQIELTADTNWQQTVADLPITDENGNRYYYYIAELDSNSNIAFSIQGNNAYYIPVSYIGNGSAVSDTGTPEISVTNSMTEKQEGELPLTGGEGTAKFYYTGGALVLLSAFVGGNRFRRRFKERRTK